MSALQNPFVLFGYAGKDYFCDREQETKELISALRNGRNYYLRPVYGYLASTAVKTLSFFRCIPSGVQFFL